MAFPAGGRAHVDDSAAFDHAGAIPTSPKHAVQLITQAEYILNLVLIGHENDDFAS